MTRRERATAAQAMLIARMAESHVFTEAEKQAVAEDLANGITKEKASRYIERLKTVIADRKAAEKQEAAR